MHDFAIPDQREPAASQAHASTSANALADALQHDSGGADVFTLINQHYPHLFATGPVNVTRAQAARMAQLVEAIEEVLALPAYQAQVLAGAPPVARHDPGSRGVFCGYDFQVGPATVGLIDINTNAGGALLSASLARAVGGSAGAARALALEEAIVDMFRTEWHLGGRSTPLRTIVIVDDEPENQYLYPEFLLFRQLFARHDIEALIVDPSMLRWEAGSLWRGDLIVDLVYNRLSDSMLDAPAHAALHEAYLARAVVLTPHPRAHALYADKRNLALLSDDDRLAALGASEATRAVLRGAVAGTARSGAPGQGGFDIRSYTYGGTLQWTAARLWQDPAGAAQENGRAYALVRQGHA